MKKLLLVIAIIIVAILGTAAFMPKDFSIEQSIIINKPASTVYNYVKLLSNGDKWSPWNGKDHNMTKEFKGTDGEVGATFSWSGNSEVGVGEEEIIALEPNKKIDFELRFTKPMKVTNHAFFEFEELSSSQTRVRWVFYGKTPFPFNLICHFMHNSAAADLAKGLANIKANLEK